MAWVIRAAKNVPSLSEAAQPWTVPPIAEHAIPIMEYIDALKENRTGVTKYNQGLDADTLNKTATGISLIQNAAHQRLELIARIFAETGVKRLFRCVHALVRKYQDVPKTLRLRNRWVEVDVGDWRSRRDLTVSVGLGTGSKEQQIGQLMALLQMDQQIIAMQGGA